MCRFRVYHEGGGRNNLTLPWRDQHSQRGVAQDRCPVSHAAFPGLRRAKRLFDLCQLLVQSTATRSDSLTFTPEPHAIRIESNFSRCPIDIVTRRPGPVKTALVRGQGQSCQDRAGFLGPVTMTGAGATVIRSEC
jgi:hypothetical protein